MSDVCRIYYGDGTIYQVSEDNPLSDAPPLNVQAIVSTDPDRGVRSTGLFVTYNWDYYLVFDDGRVWGEKGDIDFIEHVLFSNPDKCFKARNIPDEQFRTVLRAAKAYAQDEGKSGSILSQEDGSHYNNHHRRGKL